MCIRFLVLVGEFVVVINLFEYWLVLTLLARPCAGDETNTKCLRVKIFEGENFTIKNFVMHCIQFNTVYIYDCKVC